MKHALAVALISVVPCSEKCQDKALRQRLEAKYTPAGRWAIPESIVECESHGNPRAVNRSSGAGGAYQIMPSTWTAYKKQVGKKTRHSLAGVKAKLKGRAEDTALLGQHVVALKIWNDAGPGAWSCA